VIFAACWSFLIVAFFQGCNQLRKHSFIPPGSADYLQKAEKAEKQGNPEEALLNYELFLKHYPKNSGADKALVGTGKAYYRLGKYEEAYCVFKEFEDRYPGNAFINESTLYKGLSLFHLGRYVESLEVLHSLEKRPQNPSIQTVIYFHLGENYEKLGKPLSALHWYDRAYTVAQQQKTRRRIEGQIEALVHLVDDEKVFREILYLFPKGFITETVKVEQARLYYQKGQIRYAETLLLKLEEDHPDDSLTAGIHKILSAINEESIRYVCTIGCILPLSGEYERYGRDVLNALLIGAKAFQGPEKGPIRLIIRDSLGDPLEGVRVVEELARDNDLIGIIGPMLGSVAKACALKAQELKVPMITLTQKEDVSEVGNFIFQNGLTPRQQVETLVRYAMEELGISSFAVLYPQDAYGASFRDSFVRQVKEMGGEVVSQVPYEKAQTDFQQKIRELVGESYWKTIHSKDKEGKQAQAVEEIHLEPVEKRIMEAQPVQGEPPRPPFEALFIPDDYKKVAMIAPYLALYDLTSITLLGTAGWNSSKLIEMAREYVQGAIFVDGFFIDSPMPLVRDFVDRYSEAFRKVPSVLEAQGYDSLVIMDECFHRAVHKTRDSVREELGHLRDFQGLSGYTSFDEKGRAKKRICVLSVVNDRIVQVQ
jgi:ABC-type branched-subunit amino acid transport system substrate-binding protein